MTTSPPVEATAVPSELARFSQSDVALLMFALYKFASEARERADAAAQDKEGKFYRTDAVEVFLSNARHAEELRLTIMHSAGRATQASAAPAVAGDAPTDPLKEADGRPEGLTDAQYISDLEYEVNRLGLLLREAEKRKCAGGKPINDGDALGRCFDCMWSGKSACPRVVAGDAAPTDQSSAGIDVLSLLQRARLYTNTVSVQHERGPFAVFRSELDAAIAALEKR